MCCGDMLTAVVNREVNRRCRSAERLVFGSVSLPAVVPAPLAPGPQPPKWPTIVTGFPISVTCDLSVHQGMSVAESVAHGLLYYRDNVWPGRAIESRLLFLYISRRLFPLRLSTYFPGAAFRQKHVAKGIEGLCGLQRPHDALDKLQKRELVATNGHVFVMLCSEALQEHVRPLAERFLLALGAKLDPCVVRKVQRPDECMWALEPAMLMLPRVLASVYSSDHCAARVVTSCRDFGRDSRGSPIAREPSTRLVESGTGCDGTAPAWHMGLRGRLVVSLAPTSLAPTCSGLTPTIVDTTWCVCRSRRKPLWS